MPFSTTSLRSQKSLKSLVRMVKVEANSETTSLTKPEMRMALRSELIMTLMSLWSSPRSNMLADISSLMKSSSTQALSQVRTRMQTAIVHPRFMRLARRIMTIYWSACRKPRKRQRKELVDFCLISATNKLMMQILWITQIFSNVSARQWMAMMRLSLVKLSIRLVISEKLSIGKMKLNRQKLCCLNLRVTNDTGLLI